MKLRSVTMLQMDNENNVSETKFLIFFQGREVVLPKKKDTRVC
jgi:hypothetical protein